MPDTELTEEARKEAGESAAVDILVGIPGLGNLEDIQRRAVEVASSLMQKSPGARVALAYPQTSAAAEATPTSEPEGGLRLLHYNFPQTVASPVPWNDLSSAYATILALASEVNAGACILLSPDAAALNVSATSLLVMPVLEGQCDLTMPLYPIGKFEGLLNNCILAPLSRALYGKRVRFPLSPDFCVSQRMFAAVSATATSPRADRDQTILWPAARAVLADKTIGQVHVDVSHSSQTEGLDLSTVLAALVGSLFAEMDATAIQWQRVRGSQAVPEWGNPVKPHESTEPVDPSPMLESFQLGYRNLQEVWSLVLPPVTLLELKRITRIAPEQFHIPDELWVRIVYDFALAYRLRTISRTHLLGALTPLYLGFVASYAREVISAPEMIAEQRWERLAKAYEDGKSYLVSRWRWPDRFNP